eukprot:176621-Chlamydomonas_euryale.AAC.1
MRPCRCGAGNYLLEPLSQISQKWRHGSCPSSHRPGFRDHSPSCKLEGAVTLLQGLEGSHTFGEFRRQAPSGGVKRAVTP